jgi:hypothetical protein
MNSVEKIKYILKDKMKIKIFVVHQYNTICKLRHSKLFWISGEWVNYISHNIKTPDEVGFALVFSFERGWLELEEVSYVLATLYFTRSRLRRAHPDSLLVDFLDASAW